MKRALLFLASAALLLVGCAKEQVSNGVEGGMTSVTFTAGIDGGVATKALADGDGTGVCVNRCIMEIYYGDELYARQYAKIENKVATFTAQVVSNRTYTVAFWADHVEQTTDAGLQIDNCYDTSTNGLKAVAFKGTYAGNIEARDAFALCKEYTVAQVGSVFTAVLRRPFAQINVITTDVQTVAKVSDLKPEKVNVVLKNAATKYNVLDSTAVAGNTANLAYTVNIYKWDATKQECTISMDYIFAEKEKGVIDIDWKALKTGYEDVVHAFTSIPYRRNYRTNIKGALLTTQGKWTVNLNPEWDGQGTTEEGGDDPYLVNYYQAGSIAAANEALKTNNVVSIENPADIGTDIIIPAEQDDKKVFIRISGISGGDITVKKAQEGPATLAIESDSKTLDIDLPNSHVDVNKGDFTAVIANTSATTLVVGKGVKIGSLTINGGNAEIYGLVNNVIKQASSVVNFYVGTATDLRNIAATVSNAPSGKDFAGNVYITADIDLNNEEWTPIAAFQKPFYIDGQGHTIRNLKVTESTVGYIGFISTACGLTVKNLNFDTVTLSYPSTVGENARGGVIAGQVYGATVENCSVKNVDITACQKVGGLLGYIEGDTNVPHIIKNCSVEKISIKSNDPAKILQHGAGGFIGHISLGQNPLVSISGCSVKDITVADFGTSAYTSSELQRVPHVFIGNVCNTYTGAEVADITSHSVVLSNNTISGTNTVLPACIYSSGYFGWAGNAEERPAWKGGIYIDGEAWTPDYPVKNVTKGVGYPALAKAVDAASEGDEIKIITAGTYTVPGISKNVTIAAAAEGDVVFNCVGSGSIASIPNGATFKNVTMNMGQDDYHGFQHAGYILFKNCTINGFYKTYGNTKFEDCVFNQDQYAYCLNAYGDNLDVVNCTFNNKGKAFYCYNEGNPAHYTVNFTGCTFNVIYGDKAKSQIFVKNNIAGQKYTVNISDCRIGASNKSIEEYKSLELDPDLTNGKGDIRLWNVEEGSAKGQYVKVTLEGETVYHYGSLQ